MSINYTLWNINDINIDNNINSKFYLISGQCGWIDVSITVTYA